MTRKNKDKRRPEEKPIKRVTKKEKRVKINPQRYHEYTQDNET